jgi:outer membrane protein TolC
VVPKFDARLSALSTNLRQRRPIHENKEGAGQSRESPHRPADDDASSLLLQEQQLRYNVVNAREQYNLQKSNIEVSKRIYKSVENKYRQGMASSLEVTQANANYLQAENNYISSLMTLLQSKMALDKLLGNF